jgi:hypothetical protein
MLIYNTVSKATAMADEIWADYKCSQEEKSRLRHAIRTISFLDRSGCSFLNVDYIQGRYKGQNFTDLQVSILYKVSGHQDWNRNITLHSAYSVDFSSWKVLERDLRYLGKQYIEIFQRVYGTDDLEIAELEEEFAKYSLYARKQIRTANNVRENNP